MSRDLPLSLGELRRRGQQDPHLQADSTYAHVLRRVSPLISGAIVNYTSWSADSVTVMGIVIGVLGAAAIPLGLPATNVVAVVLLQAAFLLDVADGEVARIRGTAGPRGKYLDLIGHVLQNRALFAAGGIVLISTTGAALWGVAVALLAQGLATPFGFYARLYVAGTSEGPDPDHPVGSGAMRAEGGGLMAVYRRVSFLWNVPASTNLFCVALLADAIAEGAAITTGPIVLPVFFAVFGSTLGLKQLASSIWLARRSSWHS